MKLIDILNKRQYKTDKHTSHDYIQTIYDPMFEVIKDDNISLCEIGVHNGESMKLWSDYFTNAKHIVGVDIFERTSLEEVKDNLKDYNVNLHKFNSTEDTDESKAFIEQYSDGFDVIIDDGNHHWQSQIDTFKKFSPLMNTGGVYIIEDVGLEDEGAMHEGPFILGTESGKVEQTLIPMLQKEIPDIRFYVTGGKNFKNQPVGIITF